MSHEVQAALKRLNAILPLVPGLKSLNSDEAGLYCKLISSYADNGRALTRQEIAVLIDNTEQALNTIAASKLIVLDEDGNPAGAYPFTSEVREHRVQINGSTVHCMCALDALAVSPMFNKPTVIDSQCRVSGEHIHIEQNGTTFTGGTLDTWFGINWGAAASDIVCAESLCLEMIFLANASVARQWQAQSPEMHEIFELPAAVEFATGFFVPLAELCQQI